MFWLMVAGLVAQVFFLAFGAAVFDKEINDAAIYALAGWVSACALGSFAVNKAVIRERMGSIARMERILADLNRANGAKR